MARTRAAKKVRAGEYAPTTANDWLAVLRVITKAAAKTYRFPNPAADVNDFDTSTWHPYSAEQPNSLLVAETPLFIAKMRELYPQFFAMVALGFATGLRPSTLRPLRRAGATPDINWETGVLQVRRSNTIGEETMESTKTGRHEVLALPPELVNMLKWHVNTQLETEAQLESELLFPSVTGGFRARSALDKPFADVTKALMLKKNITPRAMRRTFQDLARAAEIRDVVTRAVSGHATEAMQRHYSTVPQAEVREAIGRVVSLLDFKQAREGVVSANEAPSGGQDGGHDADTKKAGEA